MEAEAKDTSADSPARRLLIDQGRLVRWQIASERAGFALKVLTGAAGLVAAGVVAVMVWQASRADGLVIKPFSAPPALVERGVTGEAMASQLLDDLSGMSSEARSSDVQRRIAADQGGGVAIEIPNTGVSISQVEQWLRERLGHQERVTGEMMLNPDGSLTLVTRIGSQALPPQSGGQADVAAMLQRAAEAILARQQPRTYSQYLMRHDRAADNVAFLKPRTRALEESTRAQAWVGLSSALQELEGDTASAAALRQALSIDPTANPNAAGNLAQIEARLGHDALAHHLNLVYLGLIDGARDRSEAAKESLRFGVKARISAAFGDHADALAQLEGYRRSGAPGFYGSLNVLAALPLTERIATHDLAGAARGLDAFEPESVPEARGRLRVLVDLYLAQENWTGALAAYQELMAAEARLPDQGRGYVVERMAEVRALVGLGRLAEAQARVAASPLDCQPCVIQRGIVAAKSGDPRGADHWFGEAIRMAPSFPQADYEWARALLDRRDPDAALLRLAQAVRKGPRYADAIELQGEALLAQGDAKAAAAKFAEAAKLTPRWGRLHLKWGEALAKLGKTDEARAKWRAAATMDLSAADRAALKARP